MSKIIKKILFRASCINPIYFLKKILQRHWEKYDKKIPKYELSEKNLVNLKALLNREQLLRLLPKNGIVAEIGVDKGEFSEKILNITMPQKLYLIDNWGSKRYHQQLRKMVENKFKEEIKKGRVEIKVGLSTEMFNNFEDNYFDWIYIDTSHSYQTTKIELEKYSRKVKPGGMITGHDFIMGNWNQMIRYGVIDAVYEFCVNNNWELVYLTMDNKESPSFGIRRVSVN